MFTFIANYNVDVFATEDEISQEKSKIEKMFNLPFPDQLKVTLSQDSIKKIARFYDFMKAEKVMKMEFYLPRGKDINSFEPMRNNMCFSSNQYIDYDEALFNTFKTNSCLITIDKFIGAVLFTFLYVNSYTEQSFDFVIDIKTVLDFN